MLAIICLVVLPHDGYSQSDTFSTYFPSGITALSAAQTASIDSLLYKGAIAGNARLSIAGYADEPGSASLNKLIAGKRAAAMKAYLLSSGIPAEQILHCAGVGNLLQTGEDSRQRRVDVILLKSGRGPDAEDAPAGVPAGKAVSAADSIVPRRIPKRSMKDLGNMKEDELLVIENLLFKVSTPEIVKESLPILNELVEVMKDYPRLKIRLEGHVCCATNSKETNKLKLGYSLSLGRAEAVKNYLEDHQIAANRLSFAGFGFSRPKVYPEVTQEDMHLNRRVEIRVISN